MAEYWIKFYHEILDDPKMATLPDRLWRRVAEVFLLAGKHNEGGKLPETKQLAWELRMSTDDLDLDLWQIANAGIIQKTETGWFVVNFAKRQGPSSATERKQQQRGREIKKQYNGHENVTKMSRNVTQITDTDTDTEAEAESPAPSYSENSDAFDEMRITIQEITGLPIFGPDGIKVINDLLELGAIREDIQAGYNWIASSGKSYRYPSQLVGPARTAMSKRLQKHPTNGPNEKLDITGLTVFYEGKQI